MANRYGEAAIMAAQLGTSGDPDPCIRWENAMNKLYPTSPAARKKSSPRDAFLGLCEEGLVKGISAGSYTKPSRNKEYAVRAVTLLTGQTEKLSRSALWQAVTNDAGKEENGQIDIVLALWNKGLIIGKP
jgi:hypothetical protein